MKLGYTCQPQFRVTQHERDLIVLKRIIESLGCGTIVKPSGDRDRYSISVANISDLVNIVIPLFENHPLSGAKHKDFLDFCFYFLVKTKKQRSIYHKRSGTLNSGRLKGFEIFSVWDEFIQKFLMSMYLGSFFFMLYMSLFYPF